jgi:Ca2+-binding EF-hand superfamily protein
MTCCNQDGDGTISSSELDTVMRSLRYEFTEDEIQNMIRHIDANGDGRVDFPEFLQLMSETTCFAGSAEDELFQTFKEFDKNGDGYISASELFTILQSLGTFVCCRCLFTDYQGITKC